MGVSKDESGQTLNHCRPITDTIHIKENIPIWCQSTNHDIHGHFPKNCVRIHFSLLAPGPQKECCPDSSFTFFKDIILFLQISPGL